MAKLPVKIVNQTGSQPVGFQLGLGADLVVADSNSVQPIPMTQADFALALGPSFYAPLETSIGVKIGSGSPTFTRATTATVQTNEARISNTLSGEARFQGARRVRNLALTTSEDFTNANWTKGSGSVSSGVTDPLGGTSAYTWTASGVNANLRNSSTGAVAGEQVRFSVWLRRRTGSGTIQLYGDGGSLTDVTAAVTTTWQRVTILGTQTDSTVRLGINLATSGDAVDVWRFQAENVTGQSNTNPSEYVSVGVLAAPFHGAGVDGVKYFNTENGNTVASNVVTEAKGADIASSTLLGYLSEQASTNLVLQSENFGTTWVATLTPTRSAAALRCGSVVLDLIGDDNAVGGGPEYYSQTVTFTGNAVKAVSLFFAKGTSTSSVVQLHDVTATANRLLAAITWSGATPVITMTTGTHLGTDTLGNGVFRARFATTSVTAANTNNLRLIPASDTSFGQAATGDIYCGGVQAENNTFCTSYIPTTTATVTRNADILTYPATGNVADAAGSIYAEFKSGGAAQLAIVSPFNGGTTAFMDVQSATPTTIISTDGTASISAVGSDSSTATRKVATAWGSARSLVYGGGTPATGTYDGSWSISGTGFAIGQHGAGGANALNGTIRNVKIWQRALPDATLQSLTT